MEFDKNIMAVYDLSGLLNGEQKMNEKEMYLEQFISKLYSNINSYLQTSSKQNHCLPVTEKKYRVAMHDVSTMVSAWITKQQPLLQCCRLESDYDRSFLRLDSLQELQDIRYEPQDGYHFDISMIALLTVLQSYVKKDWTYASCVEELLSFYQISRHNLVGNNQLSKKIIQSSLHIIMAGISSYVSFGMWIIGQLLPANTYMLDLIDGHISLTDFQLYTTRGKHDNRGNPLFCISEIGRNGFDVLYDNLYVMKCRISVTSCLQQMYCKIYIERKDKQSYLF